MLYFPLDRGLSPVAGRIDGWIAGLMVILLVIRVPMDVDRERIQRFESALVKWLLLFTSQPFAWT